MALSKQFFLCAALLLLIMVGLSFSLSVNNYKQALQHELELQTQETATALGLTLSPYMGNESDIMLEAMISSIFDRGYYQEIQLTNGDGKPLVTKTNTQPVPNTAPDWLATVLPMSSISASGEVSAGWNPSGAVRLTLHPSHAATKLYAWVTQAFYNALLILVAALLALYLLHRLLTRHFFKHHPFHTSPNGKVKVQIAFSRRRTGLDDLTGFQKKASFEKDLQQLQDVATPAYLLMIKVDGLAGLVKEQDGELTDTFIKQFAANLEQVLAQQSTGKLSPYRFFGAEFVLLVRDMPLNHIEQLAKTLSRRFAQLAKDYKRIDIAHIGIAAYDPAATSAENLAAANEAFEQAKLIGVNSYYFRQSSEHAKDGAAWKAFVYNVIDNNDYTVAFTGQIRDCKTSAILMEDAITQVHDQGVAVRPIGTFVAIAEKFSRIVELDRGMTQKVIAHIRHDNIDHAVAISLSTCTIKNPGYRRWLEKAIGQQPIAKQLVFSFSAYAVAKDMGTYQEFIEFVHSLGAKVMLKRFELQLLSLEMANALKVDYIRLPRNLSHGLAADKSKLNFVETMQNLATRLGIPMLAENVRNEQDYTLLQTIGVTGASR